MTWGGGLLCFMTHAGKKHPMWNLVLIAIRMGILVSNMWLGSKI